jgi:hypothetical protein
MAIGASTEGQQHINPPQLDRLQSEASYREVEKARSRFGENIVFGEDLVVRSPLWPLREDVRGSQRQRGYRVVGAHCHHE